MPDDTGRLTNSIADKEAQVENSTDKQFVENTNNEIHGLQVEVQSEIASDLGEESPA